MSILRETFDKNYELEAPHGLKSSHRTEDSASRGAVTFVTWSYHLRYLYCERLFKFLRISNNHF
jgi:hypothetical protein